MLTLVSTDNIVKTNDIKLRSQLRQFLTNKVYTFLGPFATLRNATVSFVMSVRPHGKARLPLDGFS